MKKKITKITRNKSIMNELNITHSQKWSKLETACVAYKKKFRELGDVPGVTVEALEQILEEMTRFPMGRHILMTGGANGIWTDYMISFPWVQKDVASKMLTMNRLEYFIIFECLSVVAQRELFLLSQKEAQKHLKEGCRLVSLPCGVMRDLLELDFSGISEYSLIGVDLDLESIQAAHKLAFKEEIKNVQFFQDDAWKFEADKSVDFINSIGLNVYESDRERVIELYRQFAKSLKKDGVLFTGVLTYPPGWGQESDWILENIPEGHYEMDKIVIDDVLDLQWQNYRTLEEIKEDFLQAGFSKVKIIPDRYCVFPAVIATK
ncbi:MAG: methyltransferase domain-containing protein [Chlamydiales bacterium]|nr:methyltransferase domain-containing protein [Chlamydiales bacterium]